MDDENRLSDLESELAELSGVRQTVESLGEVLVHMHWLIAELANRADGSAPDPEFDDVVERAGQLLQLAGFIVETGPLAASLDLVPDDETTT